MATVLPDINFDKLTVSQRLELIARIWDSITENQFTVPPSHRELIRKRLADREANRQGGAPWQDVIREIGTEGRSDADR